MTSWSQSSGVTSRPEMRERLTAMARMALNCRSVMRWSGQRGKTTLDFPLLGFCGSKGFLALYSCLRRDADTIETDCCSSSQHSPSGPSSLVSVPATASDASAFFAMALRFPTGLSVSVLVVGSSALVRLVLTPAFDAREDRALRSTYGTPLY